MRILYLSPRESWPANSGAKLRDLHLARGLARGAQVHYLFFGGASAAEGISRYSVAAVNVTRPAKYTPRKIALGLIGTQPLPVLNYTSEAMTRAITGIDEQFDLIHLDSLHMAGYLGVLRRKWPRALIALDWHNIESEGMRRFAATTSSALKRVYAAYTATGLRCVENRLLADLDGHIVCSERERSILLERAPQARIAVVPNGVDTDYYRPTSAQREQRIIFVGQMSYGPNADGAIWFAHEIWPRLRKEFPEMTLRIVGADPRPDVRALTALPGISVTGTVPDVRDYYAGAFAAIVPLRTGAGTRLKILEAMAAGVPVISTHMGAEGLAVVDGVHLLLAETAAEWLRAVVAVSRPDVATNLISTARELVVSHYDWSRIGADLLAKYQAWCGL